MVSTRRNRIRDGAQVEGIGEGSVVLVEGSRPARQRRPQRQQRPEVGGEKRTLPGSSVQAEGAPVEGGGAQSQESIVPMEEVVKDGKVGALIEVAAVGEAGDGSPVEGGGAGQELIDRIDEVTEDGKVGATVEVAGVSVAAADEAGDKGPVEGGSAHSEELIIPTGVVPEDGAQFYDFDPLEEFRTSASAGTPHAPAANLRDSDDPEELTLSQLQQKKKAAKKKTKPKFHKLGYKKTPDRPKRRRNSESDSSLSDAPPKKQGGKKKPKLTKSEERNSIIVKDPFAPIKENRRADLSSPSKIRDFIENISIIKINLWKCIDLGKRKLHALTQEEVLNLQEDAFRPYQAKMYDKNRKPHEFTQLEVVNLHGLADLRTPITEVDKFPFYLQRAIRELGPINVKRFLYFGDQHKPWYCVQDWTQELKDNHEQAFLKLLFHYCSLEKGEVELHSLFRLTNSTYNKLKTHNRGSAGLTKETVLADSLWMRKDILAFVTCTMNPPSNPPKKPDGTSRKISQEEFERRSAIDYEDRWRRVRQVYNAVATYLVYFISLVRANQGISTKALKVDFEAPWRSLFKCNADFQARVGSATGGVVATWSFVQTSTTADGKKEERKKMLVPYYCLLSFLYDSKPKFTPLAEEICDHAFKKGRYNDTFKALKRLGPRMLNVRKTDQSEVGPDEEPRDEYSDSSDEGASKDKGAIEDEDEEEQREVLECEDESGSDHSED